MRAVLGDAASANAAVAELAFENAKYVFDIRARLAIAKIASAPPFRAVAASLHFHLHHLQHTGIFRRELIFVARFVADTIAINIDVSMPCGMAYQWERQDETSQ